MRSFAFRCFFGCYLSSVLQPLNKPLHLFLIRLDSRLVERIQPQGIRRQCRGHLEEIDHFAQILLIQSFNVDLIDRYAGLLVCRDYAFLGAGVNLLDCPARDPAAREVRNQDIMRRVLDSYHRLVEHLIALLQELPDAVKVPSEEEARRVSALSVFSLGLPEKLLEPLVEVPEVVLEEFEHLEHPAFGLK